MNELALRRLAWASHFGAWPQAALAVVFDVRLSLVKDVSAARYGVYITLERRFRASPYDECVPPWLPDEIDKGVASDRMAEPSGERLDKDGAIKAWRDRPGAWRFSNSMRNAALLEAVRTRSERQLFWADRAFVTAFGVGRRALDGMRSGAYGQYAAFHNKLQTLTATSYFDRAFEQLSDRYYSQFAFDLLHDAAMRSRVDVIGVDELVELGARLRRTENYLISGRDLR